MKSLRGVGVGLSVVFGCLLLALVAELYYLLWWKKRAANRDLEPGYSHISSSRQCLCCTKFPSLRSKPLNPLEFCSSDTRVLEPQSQLHLNNKPFGEETVESELFRLQNFPGPPRFLFTIKEETKEDLESEDGKSRGDRSRKGSRSKSLSDFFHILETSTPYLTPISSPQYFTPPLTPAKSAHLNHGFGSFDSVGEAEFNFLIRSSPPPKFQFLKDAEDKLYRNKLSQDAQLQRNRDNVVGFEAATSSSMFVKDKENDQHQNVSNSSQIVPLQSPNGGIN